MAIALTLKQFLDDHHIPYELEQHKPTNTSLATAHICAIEPDNFAKGVLARCRDGYVLAIMPASRKLELNKLGGWIGQPVGLATEDDISAAFPDCKIGSLPPIAAAYGLAAIVDTDLNGRRDVYFEGGDHCTLVHISGREFDRLCNDAPRIQISQLEE